LTPEDAGQTTELHYLDDLTGLHNRRYFRERLLEEKRKADEKGATFALMMLDLDNFKLINDLHGHLAGDKVLRDVGRLLRGSLGQAGILCRYAGDEFVVILPETTETSVIEVAERVTKSLAQASWTDDKGGPIQTVTCSLGYAFYSEAGKDPTDLISWADQALYAAKRRGGNGHCGEKEISKELAGQPLVATPYLVGRERELAQLKSLHGEIRQHGGLVLIHGEMGVGKTRLTKELKQHVERTGGTVLTGGCHVDTRSIPYYPFRDAFRRYFETGEEEDGSSLETLPEYSQRELARILPGIKEIHHTELERPPDSYRLFEATRLLLQGISTVSGSTVLLIVEDIHWSDKASLDLLHYLARNLEKAPVLMYATYRTEEARKSPNLSSFLGSVTGEKLAEEIFLVPLSSESVSTMLNLLYPGVRFPKDFHEFLYRKTEGNPFFVEELLKSLSPEEIQEGLTRIEKVPASLRAVLESRIDSLSPEMREVLACGALVGEEFEFRVLCEVSDRPLSEILDAMEAGTGGHILVERIEAGEERYAFAHSLMADVLYSGLAKVRRRMWHAQTGTALERIHAGRLDQLYGQLMYHFERAENWEKALHYALSAARQARDDYANDEAIRLYKKARLMLHRLTRDATMENVVITQSLGDVYQLTGRYREALAEYTLLRDAAERNDDGLEEGQALCRMAEIHHIQGDYEHMMELAQTAQSAFESANSRTGIAASLDLVGNAYFHQGEFEKAMECCEQALKIHKKTADERGIASSLLSIGIVHDSRGDYDEALKSHGQSLDIWRRIGDKRKTASTLTSIGDVYTNKGDFTEALKHHEEAFDILREMGDIRGSATCLQSIARVHSDRGDLSEALRYFEESLKSHKEIGSKPGIALSLNGIGNVYWNRGEFEKALKYYEECYAIRSEIGDVHGAAMSLHNIGIIHANRGEYEEALTCYLESLETQREIGDKHSMALSLHSTGVILWCRGSYDEALKYHQEGLAIKRDIGSRKGAAISLISIGSIYTDRGDYQKALGSLTEALRIQEDIGDNWAKAFTLSELGRLYQNLQDPQRAVDHHMRSLDLMETMGLKAEKSETLSGIGLDYHLLGENEKALENLSKAFETAVELGAKEAEPVALEGLSEVLLSKGDFEKTRECCDRLLGIAEQRGLKRCEAAAKRIRGETLMREAARFKEAEAELKEAAQIAGSIGALPLLWQAHASLGRLYDGVGDGKKASEYLSRAKSTIEEIASNIADESLRSTYLNSPMIRLVRAS
jgi:diguanylate cyclase (GGDEF)-like protein